MIFTPLEIVTHCSALYTMRYTTLQSRYGTGLSNGMNCLVSTVTFVSRTNTNELNSFKFVPSSPWGEGEDGLRRNRVFLRLN